MADLTGMMQAAAGGAGGGGTGSYIAVGHNGSRPYFTLLDHTTPGTVSLATTYTLPGSAAGVAFSPLGDYIAWTAISPYFTLLNHTTPGTVV
jgi:hypothetical protein